LFALEEQRRAILSAACAAVARGNGPDAVRYATAAHQLRADDDTARLRALGHLLNREFADAWRWGSSFEQSD